VVTQECPNTAFPAALTKFDRSSGYVANIKNITKPRNTSIDTKRPGFASAAMTAESLTLAGRRTGGTV